MESPFPSNSWMRPKARQALMSPRSVPHRDQMESFFNPPRKVVSIPVQFVRSQETQSASATKIQKYFRGFMLRKSLKRVFAVRDEVAGIERKISPESMRGNPKERLRINELLMYFLLKLDSVTGIDACVKDCRKSVIKKIIRLQELVDSITDDCPENLMLRSTDEVSGTKDLQERSVDSKHNVAEEIDDKCVGVQTEATDLHDPESVRQENEFEDCITDVPVDAVRIANERDDNVDGRDGVSDAALDCDKVITSSCVEESKEFEADNRGDGTSDDHVEALIEGSDESNADMVVIMEQQPEWGKGRENPNLPGENEEDKKKAEVLDRLVDDGKKMMNLMMELCEKNTMQVGMLQSLSQRVDKLERAFQCERSRKKQQQQKDLAER